MIKRKRSINSIIHDYFCPFLLNILKSFFDKFLNNGIHVVFPQINPKDYTLRKTFKEEHYLDKIFNALTYRPFVS